MTVHYEILVGRVFVLANTSLQDWGVLQRREAHGQMITRVRQRLGARGALAIGGIEQRPACVVSQLEAASLIAWNAVIEASAVIDPNWHFRLVETQVAALSAKKEHFLASRVDLIANHVGKNFSQPWTTSEYVTISDQGRAIG